MLLLLSFFSPDPLFELLVLLGQLGKQGFVECNDILCLSPVFLQVSVLAVPLVRNSLSLPQFFLQFAHFVLHARSTIFQSLYLLFKVADPRDEILSFKLAVLLTADKDSDLADVVLNHLLLMLDKLSRHPAHFEAIFVFKCLRISFVNSRPIVALKPMCRFMKVGLALGGVPRLGAATCLVYAEGLLLESIRAVFVLSIESGWVIEEVLLLLLLRLNSFSPVAFMHFLTL